MKPIFIAGPCVIESAECLDTVAERIVDINNRLGVDIIFKSSFDKANRTSISSYRGVGIERGLQMLADVKNNKLLPLHQLAMSNALDKEAFCMVELEREQALAYLHREALAFAQHPMGYLLLTYKGSPIGFAKNIGNRANNLYPAEWRIRKNPMEL